MEKIAMPTLVGLSEADRAEIERFCKQVLDALSYLSQLCEETHTVGSITEELT